MKMPLPLLGEEQEGSEESVVQDLLSLSDRACAFAHEKGEGEQPPQCNKHIQEICVGCAHSSSGILRNAIDLALRQQVLNPAQARAMRAAVQSQAMTLMSLDSTAANAYWDWGSLSPEMITQQQEVIAERMQLRNDLLLCFAQKVDA